MAEDKPKKPVLKKAETVRERASKSAAPRKPRRLRRTATSVSKPLKAAHKIGKREYYLPLPDNKAGRILNKRLRVFPKFFILAWKELRQVEWPNRKQTWKLTFAVFIFAIVFGVIISVADYGLDKLFRQLLLK